MDQIGMFTAATEALAAAVGAGMVLGAFGAGVIGVLAGWPRPLLEFTTITTGYLAGLGAVILAFVDLVLRYIG